MVAAKEVTTNASPETMTDDELAAQGLVRTAFGIENQADLDGWERVEIGLGEAIDWKVTPLFEGTFRSRTERDATGLDGKPGKAWALSFFDAQGNDVFCWENYPLREAWENMDIQEGRKVRIQFLGKKEINNGERTVNLFRVWAKK